MLLYKQLHQISKKQVLVLVTSMLVTKANKKDDNMTLARISYIYYPLHFPKNINKIQALLNLGNEVNAITLVYAL